MMMMDDDEGVWIGHTFTRRKHGGGVIGTGDGVVSLPTFRDAWMMLYARILPRRDGNACRGKYVAQR